MLNKKTLSIFGVLFLCFFLLAQSNSVCAQQKFALKGQFLSDSVKIGEEIGFALSVRYPRTLNVIFPDSLYDFSPFELYRREEFNTSSDSTQSFDSVIYYLGSFEIDPIQHLSLPIFDISGNDSTKYESETDSVILIEMITEMPDSLALKENSQYQEINLAFNYPYFVVGLIAFLLIVSVVGLIFGKRILNRIKIWRLTKQHEKFIQRYNALVNVANQKKEDIETILANWKKYIEKLEGKPFTKLTTKEILRLEPDEVLANPLKLIDRAIYANRIDESLDAQYGELKTYAINKLNQKIDFIKNAK